MAKINRFPVISERQCISRNMTSTIFRAVQKYIDTAQSIYQRTRLLEIFLFDLGQSIHRVARSFRVKRKLFVLSSHLRTKCILKEVHRWPGLHRRRRYSNFIRQINCRVRTLAYTSLNRPVVLPSRVYRVSTKMQLHLKFRRIRDSWYGYWTPECLHLLCHYHLPCSTLCSKCYSISSVKLDRNFAINTASRDCSR